MRITTRRALAGLAAIAAVSSAGLISITGTAAAATLASNAPPTAQATISPQVTGTVYANTQAIGMTLPINNDPDAVGVTACSGPGTSGYRQQSFIFTRQASITPAALTYGVTGPVLPSGATGVTAALNTFGGGPIINVNPSASPIGRINNIYSVSLPLNVGGSPLPNGEYWVGIACSLSGNTDDYYWSAPITVTNSTGSAYNWQYGWAPAAPAASATAGDGSASGAFTAAAATPAATYTISATPTGTSVPGATGSPVAVTLPTVTAPGAFSFPALVNGFEYAIKVSASNGVGPAVDSNVVNATPLPAPPNAPAGFQAVGIAKGIALSWTAPTGPAVTGYTLTVNEAGGAPLGCTTLGAPVTAGLPTLTAASTGGNVTGLTPGTLYCASLRATYANPLLIGPIVSTSAAALGDGVIQQTITVSRPAGALKLTQRCAATDGFPATTLDTTTGFPAFPAIPQTSASPILSGGTAPTVVEATPGNTTAVGAADNQFGDYPDPAAQTKTNCNLNLGTAKLILTGSYKGQFFAASGAISQVSVLDTRDTDQGWTINGTMGQFNNGSFNFSGAYLGWQPKVSSTTSTPVYTQVVNAGAVVAPDAAGAAGLATARPLAVSPAPTASSGGLGLATLDARVNLLIPVTKPSGTYTGVLTISAL